MKMDAETHDTWGQMETLYLFILEYIIENREKRQL